MFKEPGLELNTRRWRRTPREVEELQHKGPAAERTGTEAWGGTGHSELGWSGSEVRLRKAGTQATQALGPGSGGVWRGEVEAPDLEELMWIWGKTTIKTAGPDWLQDPELFGV